MKTVSLELAQSLKEAGFPQDTHFYITFDKFENTEKLVTYSRALIDGKEHKKHIRDDWYAAPTAEEILEQLPASVIDKETRENTPLRIYRGSDWLVSYHVTFNRPFLEAKDKCLAEAAGKMYLYLVENHLLTKDSKEDQTKEGATSEDL